MNRTMQLTAAEVRAVMSGEKVAHAILAPKSELFPDNIIMSVVTDGLRVNDRIAICESVRVIDGVTSYSGEGTISKAGKVLPASAMPSASARLSVIINDIYITSVTDSIRPDIFGYSSPKGKLASESFLDGFVGPIRKRGYRELANEIESDLIDGRRVVVIVFTLDRADLHKLPKARRAEIKIQ